MILIRSLLFYLVFLPACVVLSTIALISHGIFRIRPYWVLRLYGRVTRVLLKVIGGVSIKVHGNSQQQIDHPILIISNHVSTLDTIALTPILPNLNFTYVVKHSLMQWKSFPFNIGCRTTWCIPVNREANTGDLTTMLEECERRFANHISVLIFPKGTREKSLTDSTEIPPTGLLIAKKLKCAVLPVFFDTINWQHGKIIKDLGLIVSGTSRIYIGDLISPEELKSIKQTNTKIIDFFQDCAQKTTNVPLAEPKQ